MNSTSDIPDSGVSPGDRFYKVGGANSLWIVQRVFVAQADGIPHVVLTRENEPDTRTVISLVALLEEINFKPDRRSEEDVNQSTQQRRKTDWYPRRLWNKMTK